MLESAGTPLGRRRRMPIQILFDLFHDPLCHPTP